MRNLLAGLSGAIIGAIMITSLLGLAQPNYSPPYDMVWFIFIGSSALHSTLSGLLDITSTAAYLITWLVLGIIIAPFSKRGWNIVRSALWIGIILGILKLGSVLLVNPEFWTAATRNLNLVYIFSTALLISLLSLMSAAPLSIILDRYKKQSEPPIPDKIETRCQCGAVFKSNPLICSECGAVLREIED